MERKPTLTPPGRQRSRHGLLAELVPGDTPEPPGALAASRRRPAPDRDRRPAVVGPVLVPGPPALLDWEGLRGVGDRPFPPTGRARHGWDWARHRRYSAAADRPFGLDWVAVRRDHLDCGTVDRLAEALSLGRVDRRAGDGERRRGAAAADRDPTPADALLDIDDRSALVAAMAGAGVDGPDHVALPVHPWQHAHVLADLFAAEWRSGVCVAVASGLGAFRPTAATRTLVPSAAGAGGAGGMGGV